MVGLLNILKYVHKIFADIIKFVVAAQPVCEMWRLYCY